MISKGTTHNNGVKLASYMTTEKNGERAELWQLRGFEATNIKDAFRDVQIMAGATKCEQPFFHLQVRNREGETLTRQQWEYAADRIERMLGLTGQPRAITFHTYEHNNDEHMHVAWSRIDEETLTAKPVPFFKDRLKTISRELELHFALEPVTNERQSSIKYAPTRAQEEQARRVGVDIHQVRNAIRDCWDRSDNGRSFQAAIEDEGLMLAQGDRRGFVVIDQGGGIHALSKRILDVTAAKIRDRLSDLDANQLPNVEQARALILDQEVQKQRQTENFAPIWNRDRADDAWQNAVISAAIEKEKIERQFVQPRDRQAAAGSREMEWLITPARPEPIKNSTAHHFQHPARETVSNQNHVPPEELKGITRQIMGFLATLWNEPELLETKARTLSAFLDEKGIALARVTKDDADRSHREAEFAKAAGRHAPRFSEGEVVAVTEPRREYRRNGQIIVPGRLQKLDQFAGTEFVASLDKGTTLHGIAATLEASDERAKQRSKDWQAIRLKSATRSRDGSRKFGHDDARAPAGDFGNHTVRTLGKLFDVAASIFESMSPTLTPEQIRDGQRAAHRREAEGGSAIDYTKYTAEMAQGQRQQESQVEAERRLRQQLDGGGRER